MTLVVGYLATAGGADALSLGVRLARTLGTDLQVCLVLAPDDVTTPRLTSDRYHEVLAEQGQAWLAEALRLVPDDVTVEGKVIVAESRGGKRTRSIPCGLADWRGRKCLDQPSREPPANAHSWIGSRMCTSLPSAASSSFCWKRVNTRDTVSTARPR